MKHGKYDLSMEKRQLFRMAVGQILREERKAQGLTLRQVSAQSSIALGYLSEVERGMKEPSSEILDNLSHNGIGVEPWEIIARAAILMSAGVMPDTADDLLNRIENYSGAII